MALEREKISLGNGVAVSRELLMCIGEARERHRGRFMRKEIAEECDTQARVVNFALSFLREHPDFLRRSDDSEFSRPSTESGL